MLPSPLTCHAPQCAEHGGRRRTHRREEMESKQRGEGGQWHTGRWSMAGDPRSRSARSLAFSCSSFPFPPLFLSCTLHCTVWAAPALLVLCSVVPPVNMTPPKGTNTVKTPQKKGQCRSSLAKGKCELESGDVEWTTGVAYLCPGHYAA